MRADTKGPLRRDHHLEAARLVSCLGCYASDVAFGFFVHPA